MTIMTDRPGTDVAEMTSERITSLEAALHKLNEENLSLHDRVAELERYERILIHTLAHVLPGGDCTAEERDLAAGQTACLLVLNTKHIYPLLSELAGKFPGAAAEMTQIVSRLDDEDQD